MCRLVTFFANSWHDGGSYTTLGTPTKKNFYFLICKMPLDTPHRGQCVWRSFNEVELWAKSGQISRWCTSSHKALQGNFNNGLDHLLVKTGPALPMSRNKQHLPDAVQRKQFRNLMQCSLLLLSSTCFLWQILLSLTSLLSLFEQKCYDDFSALIKCAHKYTFVLLLWGPSGVMHSLTQLGSV